MFSKDLGARIRELQSGHSVSISAVTVSSEGRSRYLECDEVCAQEERNRKIAIALEIDNPNISPIDTEVQYSTFLLEQARLVGTLLGTTIIIFIVTDYLILSGRTLPL
jgi:transcriptional repressor NF-X1